MKGIRKNKYCVRCGNNLDREGDVCQRCYLKAFIKRRQKYTRDSRQVTTQLKAMKKPIYDKILKEVNKELDEEESKKYKK